MPPEKYLPDFLQDFHDQKDVFKLIDKTIVAGKRCNINDMTSYPSWVDAHIYTIDVFLWAMGFYGYKLQKCRIKANYGDLNADIRKMKEQSMKNLQSILES